MLWHGPILGGEERGELWHSAKFENSKYTQYGVLHSPIKTWKSSLNDPLLNIEFNLTSSRGVDEYLFWSLDRAMECPILGIIDNLLKKIVFTWRTAFC